MQHILPNAAARFVPGSEDVARVVNDGVVDQAAWDRAPEKILWLLKDANGLGNHGGDLDMGSHLLSFAARDGKKDWRPWSRTWPAVGKVSYCLIHNCGLESLPRPRGYDPGYLAALASIAVINLKESLGGANVTKEVMSSEFDEERARRILGRVSCYAPTVVIGGNTLSLPAWSKVKRGFPEWGEASRGRGAIDKPYVHHRDESGAIWVNANHPNRGNHATYLQRIRRAIAQARGG